MRPLGFDKKVLAFYYAWYGTPWGTGVVHEWLGWNSAGYDPEKVVRGRRETATPSYPLDGLYDSSSEYTIRRHIYQARQALIDGFIVSWWGFPDKVEFPREDMRYKVVLSSDATLHKLLELAPEGFSVTLYYENAKYDRASVSENIIDDFMRILERYGRHPKWLKVGDRPVIVVYGRVIDQLKESCTDDIEEWRRIRKYLKEEGYEVFIIGDSLDPRYAEVMDGLHTYNPIGFTTKGIDLSSLYERVSKELRKRGKLFVATVTPGFDNYLIKGIGRLLEPRQDGRYYIDSWNTALKHDPDWIFITSWNEWYENSQIEPSVEYGTMYLFLTKQQVMRFKSNME